MKCTTFALIAALAAFAQSVPLLEKSPKTPIEFRSDLWGETDLISNKARDIDQTKVFKDVKRDDDETESENVKRGDDEIESENIKRDEDETESENIKRDDDEIEWA
ncbi:hypothetical protein OIDMADRAFT_20753 [Oidiodendron maius Zn]|uniref:Uncharacterized protein n=1 Tax=Oidiodendron maius (strain Zn) TaxID=913774 RepID=A0A0C3D346_OIDMZ|nr:hypothetical protein OIDMADRAFT_20753 [Oidiodendron maius Zn]